MTTYTFEVLGTPAPKGSVDFVAGRYAKPSSPRLAAWESVVAEAAFKAGQRANRSGTVIVTPRPWFPEGPVWVEVTFHFAMPKSWSSKKRGQHWEAPHTQTPDLDKLVRATLDPLKGIAFTDDAQVAQLTVSKRWSTESGATITVRNA